MKFFSPISIKHVACMALLVTAMASSLKADKPVAAAAVAQKPEDATAKMQHENHRGSALAEAAFKAMQDEDWRDKTFTLRPEVEKQIRAESEEIAKKLWANISAITPRINEATAGMKSRLPSKRAAALMSFYEIVTKHNRGYNEALRAVTVGMRDKERWVVRPAALAVCCALVAKEYGYKEALNAATEGLQDDDALTRKLALEVFRALVVQGQTYAYKEAGAAAAKGMQSSEKDVRGAASGLTDALRAAGVVVDGGETSIPLLTPQPKPLPVV